VHPLYYQSKTKSRLLAIETSRILPKAILVQRVVLLDQFKPGDHESGLRPSRRLGVPRAFVTHLTIILIIHMTYTKLLEHLILSLNT
jgi:hypothetical protein